MERRHFLGAAGGALLAGAMSGCAWAPGARTETMPLVFVHGNGDNASIWQNTLWWFESNGWPRDRLFALQQPWPLARDEDAKDQPGRSSAEQYRAFVQAEVDRVLASTGAKQVALIASSRGGLAVRNYVQNGGADKVSHVILCGTPNHGVWSIKGWREGSEFSGTGALLTKLNKPKNDVGDEVVGPVRWLTLRSDAYDKYAQPDAGWLGAPGKPTGIDVDGPALKGANNVVLPGLDHREVAFSPASFQIMFRFLTGQDAVQTSIWPELNPVLSGLITGLGLPERGSQGGNFANNLPLEGAALEVYAVNYDTGERVGSAVYRQRVGADGRWGPFTAVPGVPYEFMIRASGYATTHIYRTAFARGSNIVHLTPQRIADEDLPAHALILLERPRGYLDPNRYKIVFDGQSPPPGVPTARIPGIAQSKLALGSGAQRSVVAEFHGDVLERLAGRSRSARENHVTVLEIGQ